MNIAVGDILEMKKKHPCGGDRMEVLRVGMDFRLCCTACGHEMMVPRVRVEKHIRRVLPREEE